ncbi:hypothetical protein DPMN_053688 [Dreissena polymorpha]|uniref:Uncharacterized protein n=1 Tax=Dreissena polymorpha TaxID=45954 RepID=A0A9D4CP46_DREPO|nr:hypothetical protein DPMN_053688 [Dreissena polymorpha]
MFELGLDIIWIQLLTKLLELDSGHHFHDDWAKNVTSRVHVIQLTGTIFKLNSHIKETNVLTKFHENWAKNVTSRVFTCFHYIHIEKNAPATGGHVFSPIWIIFELVRDINKTNVLTNFHDDWENIVTSRVFTRKTAPPGSLVIQLTGTIFELNSHIKEINVLTKFHENWAKNVTSKKNAPPTGGHIFPPIWTIFELIRDINKTNPCYSFDWNQFELDFHIKETNVLTKFQENLAKIVTSRVFTCFHCIHIEKNAPPTDINKTNVLTDFHDDWAKNVSSRVFTRKTAPPTGSHVIQLTGTIFELNSHFKETYVLTKFHENWAKNVTSREFTCFHYVHIEKNAPPTGGHVF